MRISIGIILVMLAGRIATANEERLMAFSVSSAAFREGEWISQPYTCEGADLSPPLSWSEPPAATKSVALIADDPDAPGGTWVHWVLYNLPPDVRQLPEGLPTAAKLDGGGLQGVNDFGRLGYGGPCPPPGKPHRYFFKLYALDSLLTLPPTATKAQLERAMQGHILAQAQLAGRYQR